MTEINFASKKAKIGMRTRSLGWSSIEGHIAFLVEVEYPKVVKGLGLIIAELDRNVGELQQLQITINDGILDVSEANVQVLLEAKRVSNGWYGPVEYIGTFGVDNISDWRIWDEGVASVSGTGVSALSFTVSGAVAGAFHPTAPVIVDGETYIIQSATNPPIPPAPQITTVVVQSGGTPIAFGPGLTVIPPVIVYVYNGVGWDSDPAITQEVEAFATGHDQLTHPLGLTGTYGINERLAQLQIGSGLQAANLAAYENFILYYDAYKQ